MTSKESPVVVSHNRTIPSSLLAVATHSARGLNAIWCTKCSWPIKAISFPVLMCHTRTTLPYSAKAKNWLSWLKAAVKMPSLPYPYLEIPERESEHLFQPAISVGSHKKVLDH